MHSHKDFFKRILTPTKYKVADLKLLDIQYIFFTPVFLVEILAANVDWETNI